MPKLNLTRRWKKARPGSVLILVIALLVLLALIGTAYLSSTQTERYSSVQNSINTEADLLIQGLQTAVNSQITAGLYGGSTYRPPQGEMPTYATAGASGVSPASNGYVNYVSGIPDPNLATTVTPPNMFLADRIPSNNGAPIWNNISWPLFTDASGNYTFDSPFEDSTTMYLPINKGSVAAYPTSKTINGVQYPALQLYIPNGKIYVPNNATQISANYLTPSGPSTGSGYTFVAASASGDGIADAGLFKLPVGQIDGITYYGAIRVVDGNSAINISSANSQGVDVGLGTSPSGVTIPPTNFGFFRSNIGLQELLNGDSLTLAPNGYPSLNSLRFYNYPFQGGVTVSGAPSNFSWFSFGDEIESLLTRVPNNTGMGQIGTSWNWLGQSATSILAYKYSLINPSQQNNWSLMERALPNSLLNFNLSQSTPWSPAQYPNWYANNFQCLNNYSSTGSNTGAPLRTVLVGNNAISNGVPSQYGLNGGTTPPVWSNGTTYNFGDWVTDGPVGGAQRSFVCIQPHLSNNISPNNNEPYNTGTASFYNSGAVPYWAGAQSTVSNATDGRSPGMPFTTLPVKTSINTATFSQLWLGFCQVMCDSITTNAIPKQDTPALIGTIQKQWQPPMQPAVISTSAANQEQQLGMFRSVIRDTKTDATGRVILSSAQMLKLRAAIAAVNTMDLRDGDDDVTSKNITLLDDSNTAGSGYDVEVYGTERQPYISEVVIQTDGTPYTPGGKDYIAVEICNPYPKPITLTNWQIGSLNRSTFPTMTLVPGAVIPTVIVPAEKNGVPGLVILEEGTEPHDVSMTIAGNQALYASMGTNSAPATAVPGLYTAAIGSGNQPNEIFLMRPRLASGTFTISTSTNDTYSESQTVGIADLVPVDQLDLTGLVVPTANASPNPTRFLYRRANDAYSASSAPNKLWHCVYPGLYDPTRGGSTGRYFYSLGSNTAGILTDPTGAAPCYLAGPTGGFQPGLATAAAGEAATIATLPIELNNAYMAGPNQMLSTDSKTMFPFGGFARNLDMLKIPFIGAYRIRPIALKGQTSSTITELNSVTMDSALAYENSTAYPLSSADSGKVVPDNNVAVTVPPTVFNEQVGRFCPIGDPLSSDPSQSLDFGPGYTPQAGVTTPQPKIYWHYHWARKLFDYFTVQAPSDDYYPNADPTPANTNVTPAGSIPAKYPDPGQTTVLPYPVANTNSAYANAQTAGHSEDTTGVEGLISINTAPAAVLAQVPFVGVASTTQFPSPQSENALIAQAIVDYRNTYGNGPFMSIMDLYKVQKFMTDSNKLLPAATAVAAPSTGTRAVAAGPNQGVFSPSGIGIAAGNSPDPGAVPYDFQDRFLMLNNISNLITTRSDTFTCYVLLQGWRNVGTGNASLAVQRRVAFLVDRNAVTPGNNQPASTRVPSE